MKTKLDLLEVWVCVDIYDKTDKVYEIDFCAGHKYCSECGKKMKKVLYKEVRAK